MEYIIQLIHNQRVIEADGQEKRIHEQKDKDNGDIEQKGCKIRENILIELIK